MAQRRSRPAKHWPKEDGVAELDASLARMGLDHVDLIYAMGGPTAPDVAVVVEQVALLIDSGRARAWGTGMWSGRQLAEAIECCDAAGVTAPVAAQMACSLADQRMSADPTILDALDRGAIGLVAAHVLAGGSLSGKYLAKGAIGRADADDSPVVQRGLQIAAPLAALAAEWGVPTTHLAIAFALDHPNLASVVMGATSSRQIEENVAALGTFDRLDATQRRAITAPIAPN